jgi:hypothetical protein
MADRVLALLAQRGIKGSDAETALAEFRRRGSPKPAASLIDHYGPDAIRVAAVVLSDALKA